MLDWPEEIVSGAMDSPQWSQDGSNYCLDFHGDPINAELVVLSDGNHHMALLETLQEFKKNNPGLVEIFYATTPPGPILKLFKTGSLRINNLVLTVKPHLFFSPPHVLDSLVDERLIKTHIPFMKNQGNVLLVKKGNPKQILGPEDLARNDVKLFLSNPNTETVSYKAYFETLKNMAELKGIDINRIMSEGKVVYGDCIHHREAPQSIVNDRADVAMVYYHLALRYTRIFGDLFEMVPLAGTIDDYQPASENVISYTNVGLIGDGGLWGKRFFEFLTTFKVTEIYNYHGFQKI